MAGPFHRQNRTVHLPAAPVEPGEIAFGEVGDGAFEERLSSVFCYNLCNE
ncbi:MAG: hypothetical protein IKZ22_03370 [Kiritimatiellae bacterium]|nr:hypothetical protein [Kiritimatiellia bacterium]